MTSVVNGIRHNADDPRRVRITRLSAVHESLRCRHVTQHENAVFVSLETSPTERPHQHGRLVELTRPFLKLGAISFGGPAAHIALMRDEVVERRQWPTEQESLDLLGATNLIPGANSTEMAIHIGHRRAGNTWATRGRDLLHPPGRRDRVDSGVGLRAVRDDAAGACAAGWHHLRHYRRHRASHVGTWPSCSQNRRGSLHWLCSA
jgi:hypothetical protein